MPRCVSIELDYGVDICIVPVGSHREYLYLSHSNLNIYTNSHVTLLATLITLWSLLIHWIWLSFAVTWYTLNLSFSWAWPSSGRIPTEVPEANRIVYIITLQHPAVRHILMSITQVQEHLQNSQVSLESFSISLYVSAYMTIIKCSDCCTV
jgi:hypothetical protein